MKTQIKAEVVADSLSPQGDRLTSLLITFPRIILAEINTHRSLSKNTSSSRAIPFKKMVEAVQNDPFIPVAWQKNHSGMQGTEYFTDELSIQFARTNWLTARDNAIKSAMSLHSTDNGYGSITKQFCNRLLEPFMWTTMLITGSKEGWDNFFSLRCPAYKILDNGKPVYFKSKKEVNSFCGEDFSKGFIETDWLQLNKGQAEIHLMDLAEKIYDAMNESTPKQLQEGQWHIPFEDKINYYNDGKPLTIEKITSAFKAIFHKDVPIEVKISTAMAARTSYTVIGDEKEIDYKKMIELHDRLLELRHMSPFEHCARAMSDEEYFSYHKGLVEGEFDSHPEIGSFFRILEEPKFMKDKRNGWCRNFKGFTQYRHFVEEKKLNI